MSGELDRFRAEGELALPEGDFFPNEYALLKDHADAANTALARIDPMGGWLRALIDVAEGVQGIRPRNKEQYFALDALLDPTIVLVTIMGKAGTGKTLLALAAGLEQVLEEDDLPAPAHLPADVPDGQGHRLPAGLGRGEAEPLDAADLRQPRAAPGRAGRRGTAPARSTTWFRRGALAVEPLTHIRGRSIPQQFMLVDEAQNLTPLEVKTILTRVGENTKLVLTGDPWQIDTPYIDSSTNGFNHVVSHFRTVPLAAHVELRKGERSKLAEYAANLL